MLFDKFAGIVERHFPDLVPTLQRARIFLFQAMPEEVLPEKVTSSEMEGFFLPFPVIAIEDSGGVILLSDTVKDQIGFVADRRFIEFCAIGGRPGGGSRALKANEKHSPFTRAEYISEIYHLSIGSLRVYSTAERGQPVGAFLEGSWMCSKKGKYESEAVFSGKVKSAELEFPIPPDKMAATMKVVQDSTVRNVLIASKEVMFFNSPEWFVLESTPAKKTRKNEKKILRSQNRPSYTMAKPTEIRRVMHLSKSATGTSDRKLRVGHDRRSHPRRYRHSDGTIRRVVRVKACWVGPSTSIVGNRKYVVRLDI